MRNKETWADKIFPKLLSQFTPRIQADLREIPWPKNVKGEVKSLFLYGPTETGKTIHSAFLCLQENKNLYLGGDTSGKEFIFVSFPELFSEIKATFGSNEISEIDVLEKYKKVYLLVLDDFGVKNASDWFLELLYIIINYRYEYLLKTIITSNTSLEDISNKLGDDRISSRIGRMCIISDKKKTWKNK